MTVILGERLNRAEPAPSSLDAPDRVRTDRSWESGDATTMPPGAPPG